MKITYVDALNNAIAYLDGLTTKELTLTINRLTELRDAIVEHTYTKDKPISKKQTESDNRLANAVLVVLSNATYPMTVAAIKEANKALADVDIPKLSAIVWQLFRDDKVGCKEITQNKRLFFIA